MTEEEKRMVMQFMGQTYGQMKKQDDMLVSSSGNLRPKSEEMKRAFAETARIPTASQQPQAPQPVPPQPEVQVVEPAAQPAVSFEQAVTELAQVEQQPFVQQPVANTNQLEFDLREKSVLDELLEVNKSTNLLLKDIKLLLEKNNGKPAVKKAPSKKPG